MNKKTGYLLPLVLSQRKPTSRFLHAYESRRVAAAVKAELSACSQVVNFITQEQFPFQPNNHFISLARDEACARYLPLPVARSVPAIFSLSNIVS